MEAALGRSRSPEDVTGGRKVWMFKDVYYLGMLYIILWENIRIEKIIGLS